MQLLSFFGLFRLPWASHLLWLLLFFLIFEALLLQLLLFLFFFSFLFDLRFVFGLLFRLLFLAFLLFFEGLEIFSGLLSGHRRLQHLLRYNRLLLLFFGL
jgi:hypothetical protein